MKYAVIKTGGKQYLVAEGDEVSVEHLVASKTNESYTFEEVLLYVEDGNFQVGNPFISGFKVVGTVLQELKKGEKIRVSKFKAKAKYRRVTGHRQSLTSIKITQIGDKKKVEKVEAKKVEGVEKVTKKKATQK